MVFDAQCWVLGMFHESSKHQAAVLVAAEVLNLKEQAAIEGHEEQEATEVEQNYQ